MEYRFGGKGKDRELFVNVRIGGDYMSRKITENEIKMLQELTAEIKSEVNEELSLEENMRISLANRVENIDEEKAVEEICSGIQKFEDILEQLDQKEDRKAFLVEILNQSKLNEKTVQEQYEFLAGVMENFAKEAAEHPEYDLEELESFCIKKDGEITVEDLKQLKELVAEYLDEFSLLHEDTEVFDGFFDTIGREACEKIEKIYENPNEKYYMALAVYILQMQGKLESLSSGMGAREIGAAVAAFFASFKAKLDGFLGKIPWDKVLEILKKIATAVMTVFLCVAVAVIVFKVQKVVFFLAAAVLGYGVIGILAAAALSVGCGVKTVDWLIGMRDRTVEVLTDVKDFVVEKYGVVKKWILETALPALKEFWQKMKEKVDCYVKKWQTKKPDTDEAFVEFELEDDVTVEA